MTAAATRAPASAVRLHAESGRYPGLGGSATTAVPLTGPEQNVANPPGGSPASISAVPGVGGLLGGGGAANLSVVGSTCPGRAPPSSSAPLTAPLQLTGSPTVKLQVYGKGQVTLFAKLYDVADNAQPPNLPEGWSRRSG